MSAVIVGDRFARWVIIGIVKRRPRGNPLVVAVRCDCGTERTLDARSLTRGQTMSCGCFNRDQKTTHGRSRTPEYGAWKNMKGRCTVPTHHAWANYGGRGIRVCDLWLTSFDAFFAELGERPSPDHELDRINNEGDYEPGNCRWATIKENLRNTRSNRFITLDGLTLTVAEWAERTGQRYDTIHHRMRRGQTEEQAIRGGTDRRYKAQRV
jgi:hypothetical protein